jgi:general secretion pathway protein M
VPHALPSGWPGRFLALGVTMAVLGALWIGVAAPLLGWYAERAMELEHRRALVWRMTGLAEGLPDLRHQAQAALGPGEFSIEDTLEGASDALAGAALQEGLQEMAARAGAPLSSAEALPGEPAGLYRRIRVRVTFNAPWSAVVRLLQEVGRASPRMLVEEFQLRWPPTVPRSGPRRIEASFTAIAFRASDGPQTPERPEVAQ